jgi:hypothetical protein
MAQVHSRQLVPNLPVSQITGYRLLLRIDGEPPSRTTLHSKTRMTIKLSFRWPIMCRRIRGLASSASRIIGWPPASGCGGDLRVGPRRRRRRGPGATEDRDSPSPVAARNAPRGAARSILLVTSMDESTATIQVPGLPCVFPSYVSSKPGW